MTVISIHQYLSYVLPPDVDLRQHNASNNMHHKVIEIYNYDYPKPIDTINSFYYSGLKFKEFHNVTQPTIIWRRKITNNILRVEWWKNGMRHCDTGPAILEFDDNGKVTDFSYWILGNFIKTIDEYSQYCDPAIVEQLKYYHLYYFLSV